MRHRRIIRFVAFVICLCAAGFPAHAQLAKATTIAGGEWPFLAPYLYSLGLYLPLGHVVEITFDPAGNLYFIDNSNVSIGMISPQGILQTLVAGYGTQVPANIPVAVPQMIPGVVADPAGNVYFSEPNSYDVQKLTPDGVLSIYAGLGLSGIPGTTPATQTGIGLAGPLALDAAGNLYICSQSSSAMFKVDPSGNISIIAGGSYPSAPGYVTYPVGAPATSIDFGYIFRATADAAGNLYVAERGGQRVVIVVGGLAYEVPAFDGIACLGIAVDSQGSIFVTTTSQVLRVKHLGGTTYESKPTVIAGTGAIGFSGDGGPAASATFNTSLGNGQFGGAGIAVDASGAVYVADTSNERIRRIDMSSNNPTVTTFAGNGQFMNSGDGNPAWAAYFSDISDIAFDAAGNLYVADQGNQRVRKIDGTGTINAFAGNQYGQSIDGIPAADALISPSSLAFDSSGNLWISTGTGPSLASGWNERRIDSSGIITTPFPQESISMSSTRFDSAGNLYGGNEQAGLGILTLAIASGTLTNIPTTFYAWPTAVDHSGNVLVGDVSGGHVYKISPTGTVTLFAGNTNATNSGDGGLAINAALTPFGLAIDGSGNVYVGSGTIRKITPAGYINTVSAEGGMVKTTDAAGRLYFVLQDYAGSSIVRLDAIPPMLTSFSPPAGTPGGAAFALTVFGQGFDIDSVVRWNGSARPTSYVSSTQLVAQISGADIATAGTANITVFNPGLGGAASAASIFSIGVPIFTSGGVVNGATFQPGLAPGSLISVFGTNLASSTAVAPSLPLPTVLGGATLNLNGTALPLFYASPGQINAQLPFSASSGLLTLVNGSAASQPVAVVPTSPAIFQGAGSQGTILNADYSLADASHPAPAGSTVMIYCTGLGGVTQAVTEGTAAPPAMTIGTPQVFVNASSTSAVVSYSGLAPGLAGLYQVNFQLPSDVPTGTSFVRISLNGIVSNSVSMATTAAP